MYRAFYIYRVPRENVPAFLRINTEAGDIYRRYGAVDSQTSRLTQGDSKYGCAGLSDLIETTLDEELFVGVDCFRDRQQFQELMARLDTDPRINELYKQIQQIIDLKKIVRWEAEDVA